MTNLPLTLTPVNGAELLPEITRNSALVRDAFARPGLTPAALDLLEQARKHLREAEFYAKKGAVPRYAAHPKDALKYGTGALRRAAWVTRHGVTRMANHDHCPCLLGTKKQLCAECLGDGCRYDRCSAHYSHPCGWSNEIVDHYRTWVRAGVKAIFTTEPYRGGSIDTLTEWSARKHIAVFQHPSEEGFHNPGGCLFFAFMAQADAPAYASLEPNAVRLGGAL